jgi:hypothetical protein
MKTQNNPGCRVEIDNTALNLHLFSAGPPGNRSLRTRLRAIIDPASKIITGYWFDLSDSDDDEDGG